MTEIDDRARLHIENGVATLTLSRPEVQNALDTAMSDALAAALDQCEMNEAVRVVILRGSGENFAVGDDVPTLGALLLEPEGARRPCRAAGPSGAPVDPDAAPHAQTGDRQHQGSRGRLRRVAGARLRSVADAVFTPAYCHIGATPDGGSTFHLPRTVGRKKAMEIALLGDRFSGAEAERWGLIKRAVAAERLEEETARLAQRLATGPTLAYGGARRLLNAAFAQPLEGHLEAESECFAASTLTGSFAEASAHS